MNHISAHELIEFRKRFNISQERLAIETGISSYEIGQVEQDKLKLRKEQHKALLLFLNRKLMEVMWL